MKVYSKHLRLFKLLKIDKVACLEEIAKEKLLELAQPLSKNQYGQYLIKRANQPRRVIYRRCSYHWTKSSWGYFVETFRADKLEEFLSMNLKVHEDFLHLLKQGRVAVEKILLLLVNM